MAYPKVEHDVVIDKLMDVFRSSGYDGASMATLAEATQLKKASLYHRFPEGKEAMAHAVLSYVAEWTQTRIADVLFSAGRPVERLDTVLKAIDELYDGGRLDCILRALSHGSAANVFQPEIASIFGQWLDAFQQLAHDFGHDQLEADRLAKLVITKIQGTLILARALQDPSLFKEALNELRAAFIR